MRKRLLTASLLGLAACAAPREAHSPAAEQASHPSAARTTNALVDRNAERARVESVLDDFHDAASKADGDRYFGHLAPDAVFYGTDATERWTTEEFRAYADPIFSEGRGWTYVPVERAVFLDDDGDVAWFDERLLNTRYGALRGTGVLVLRDGRWRIVQYNLAFPIPNRAALEVRGVADRYAPVGTQLSISGDEVRFTVTASPVEPAVGWAEVFVTLEESGAPGLRDRVLWKDLELGPGEAVTFTVELDCETGDELLVEGCAKANLEYVCADPVRHTCSD